MEKRWSPDGGVIAFVGVTESGPELWIVRPDGSDAKRVLTSVDSFDWYGDSGRVILYSTPAELGRAELRAMSLDTKDEVVLLDGPFISLDVAPDGTSVAYIRQHGHSSQQFYLLPLESPAGADGLPSVAGPAEPLTEGDGLWHVHTGAFSPDGSSFVYDRDTDEGDVLLIENYE